MSDREGELMPEFVHDLIESAWGLLANVSGGNWEEQSPEWQDAVKRWRSNYHAHLDEMRAGTDE